MSLRRLHGFGLMRPQEIDGRLLHVAAFEPVRGGVLAGAIVLSWFGSGEEARRRSLPFDPSCSEEWKRSWIAVDIALRLQ